MSIINKNITELRQRVESAMKAEMFAAQMFLTKKVDLNESDKESYYDKLHQNWLICKEATELHKNALEAALVYVNKLKRLKEKESQLLSEINSILADIDQLENK